MFERALTKCFNVFFIIFAIYPIETFQSNVGNQKEHLVDSQSAFPSYAQSILQAAKSPIFRSVRTGTDLESGFDFTPDEYQKFKIWEKGEIPFVIDIPSFSDKSLRDKIRWFLNEVNTFTKLNFIELPRPPSDYNERRWVYFLNRQSFLGCHDVSMRNFTLRGTQRVVLGYDCIATGGGLAEIVLALAGVPPQHNAPDRNKYIHIIEENILAEKKYLFNKLGNDEWLFHDLPYDFDSAGHFHQHKHSVHGGATIKLKSAYRDKQIGVQNGFSELDILKINMLYTYIVKKSSTFMPACRKLFEGVDDSNIAKMSNSLQPLSKPYKYTGIEVGSNKEENDKSRDSSAEDDIKSDQNTGVNLVDDNKSDKDDDSRDTTENLKYKGSNYVELKNNTKLLKSYKDPLLYLSDYQTD